MRRLQSVAPATNWWFLSRPAGDGTRWFRDPIATWALDATGAVVPMVVGRGGTDVVPADVAAPSSRLVHDAWWKPCGCGQASDPSPLDPSFCRFDAGVIG